MVFNLLPDHLQLYPKEDLGSSRPISLIPVPGKSSSGNLQAKGSRWLEQANAGSLRANDASVLLYNEGKQDPGLHPWGHGSSGHTQLGLALVPKIQQRCRESGEHLKEWWEPTLWGKTERDWCFLHGEEKAHIFPVLREEGGSPGTWMMPHGDDRGNWYEVHWGRFHFHIRKNCFTEAWSAVPLLTKSFQDVTGQDAG